MWANRRNPRTPCIVVLIEDGIRPVSPRWRMKSSGGGSGGAAQEAVRLWADASTTTEHESKRR
jgi:hypothetical protein